MISEEETDVNMKLSQLKSIMNENYNTASYIEEILEAGYEINSSIKSTPHLESKQPKLIGCTALHLAFMENCTDGFEKLLDAGEADYTVKNRDGLTVFHQIVEEFYENESRFRLDSEYATLIMVDHSNNLANPCTSYGLSHLHAACLCNNADLVKSFLESGVPVDDAVKMDSPYFPGYTPLHFAVRSYGFETVQVLLERGANQNLENAEKKTPLLMLIEQKIKLRWTLNTSVIVPDYPFDDALDQYEKIMHLFYKQNNNDCVHLSPFHLACTMEDSSLLENILENGVDVNLAVDQNSLLWPGFTGLHFAALCNFENVMLLLSKGAKIEAADTAFDVCLHSYEAENISMIISAVNIWKDIVLSDNQTALVDLVIAMSDSEEFEVFMENSAGIVSATIPTDSILWPGFTILHVAVQLFIADTAIVNICLKAGADVTAQSANGSSALHLALRKKKKRLVDLLLRHHREQLTNLTDDENLSVLHIACTTRGHEDFVRNLLQSGVDVNLVYRGSFFQTGFTPLHDAVLSGNHELVRELLKFGADRYAPDCYGFTPIHWVFASLNPDEVGAELFARLDDVRESIVGGLSHLHAASYVDSPTTYGFISKLLAMPETNVNVAVVYIENAPLLDEFADMTPFRLAAQRKDWVAMQLLASATGFDLLAKQPNGSTPLYDALNLAEHEHEARPFIGNLMRDKETQRKVEQDVGMTMLHLACFMKNMEEIERLLKDGEDPNAQIHADSPVWPGYTPLHVLVRYNGHCSEMKELLRKLEVVFDCTLANADGDTALHLAYKHERQSWLRELFDEHRDYKDNPANNAGLSYFHVACSVTDVDVVERFLNAGVDVNSFVDPFYDEPSLAGRSALHMALNPKRFYNDNDVALNEIVDALLRNGAKVNAKDASNDSALHAAVKLGKARSDVLRTIIEAGADVNALDAFGMNPWYLLLSNGDFSSEQLELFIEKGCRLHGFSPRSKIGYAALIFTFNGSESREKMILFDAILKHPRVIEANEAGRTVVHSLVHAHNSTTKLSGDEYAELVEQLLVLSDGECDIDEQDNEGLTALHVAAICENHYAIEGLLIAGADINVVAHDGDEDVACECMGSDVSDSDNESIVFANHVKKLELLGLYASQVNRDFAASVFERRCLDEASLRETVRAEFELAKSVEIPLGSLSLSLRDFLTETYSVMTIQALIGDRTGKLIKRFFRDFKDARFSELRSIFKLQYRKALARSRLIERASDALDRMSRCTVERARLVVNDLTNDQLELLIEA